MKLKKFLKTILIFLLPIFLLNFLVFTLAWTGPTEAPPGGNVPSFLSVSDATQFKEGALGIGGVFQAFLVQLVPGEGATTPTCNAASRGTMWLEEGGAGEKDEVLHCSKNSAGNYVWERSRAPYWEIIDDFVCGENLTDARDSQVYSTIQIGNQCWMQENLNVGTMITSCDGGHVGTCSDQGQSAQHQGTDCDNIQKYCYGDDVNNCNEYGGLYQYQQSTCGTSSPGQGICPEGWRLPSDNEWKTLEMYLGMTPPDAAQSGAWRNTGSVGSQLADFTSGGDNASGFSGLPGGFRLANGSFDNLGTSANFWSSSPSGGSAWSRTLHSSSVGVYRNTNGQANGFSVRCLRD